LRIAKPRQIMLDIALKMRAPAVTPVSVQMSAAAFVRGYPRVPLTDA
jgi:hypothetical protein